MALAPPSAWPVGGAIHYLVTYHRLLILGACSWVGRRRRRNNIHPKKKKSSDKRRKPPTVYATIYKYSFVLPSSPYKKDFAAAAARTSPDASSIATSFRRPEDTTRPAAACRAAVFNPCFPRLIHSPGLRSRRCDVHLLFFLSFSFLSFSFNSSRGRLRTRSVSSPRPVYLIF